MRSSKPHSLPNCDLSNLSIATGTEKKKDRVVLVERAWTCRSDGNIECRDAVLTTMGLLKDDGGNALISSFLAVSPTWTHHSKFIVPWGASDASQKTNP